MTGSVKQRDFEGLTSMQFLINHHSSCISIINDYLCHGVMIPDDDYDDTFMPGCDEGSAQFDGGGSGKGVRAPRASANIQII